MLSTTRARTAAPLALLAVVTLMSAARGIAAQESEAAAPRIPLAEFKKLVDRDAVIVLDIRGDEAYRSGHVPGAISVPLDAVQGRAGEWKTANKPIVTYCS